VQITWHRNSRYGENTKRGKEERLRNAGSKAGAMNEQNILKSLENWEIYFLSYTPVNELLRFFTFIMVYLLQTIMNNSALQEVELFILPSGEKTNLAKLP
jgi:hypothetical protein